MRGIKAGLVAAFVFAVAGCAMDGGASNLKAGIDDNVDWVKMSVITQDARMRGYQIVWVNPPQKKMPSSENR